jgi:tRNA pseudouridine32 synthase / 23S rRNA pseudouridine746 synthase
VPTNFTLFDPQPSPEELPERLPSPFAGAAPVPVARRAAMELQAWLVDQSPIDFAAHEAGKMLGVLVAARPDGRLGYLRGFSGTLAGKWVVDGFVPPVFEAAARQGLQEPREAAIATVTVQLDRVEAELREARGELASITTRHDAASQRWRTQHGRHPPRPLRAAYKRMRSEHGCEQKPWRTRIGELEATRATLRDQRVHMSMTLLTGMHDMITLTNARGESVPMRSVFAPGIPPGGSGECAGPKLLHHAYAHGLRPVALAEFWWGAPPRTGGRHHASFYPACRSKCGPILNFMLQGLDAEPAPPLVHETTDPAAPQRIFEDAWLAVVAKPPGLLSVPGRNPNHADSVLLRLRDRYPTASGPLLVHRLDLPTSGLLLVAKTLETYIALQRQFTRREIEKRYVAWLEGDVRGDAGMVELPLRVDIDDRPRQIHDPVHGKPSLTRWKVLERDANRTKVAMFPHTGRTHQLRVHASHPLGIGHPIVGDALYGRPGERLMLHAESLTFTHPVTNRRVAITLPAPF